VQRMEIRFSGFGGQGVVFASILLGTAAVEHDGLKAVQTQSYGAEARGGAVRAELIISQEPVEYPLITATDVLVAMSQAAMDRYLPDAAPGSLIIYDSDLVKPPNRDRIRGVPVSATQMARQELGQSLAANIIMVGVVLALTNAVSVEGVRKALVSMSSPKAQRSNEKALELGLEAGKNIR
jgi:2-oxoglutarate ferredoxin oxidoreductase subunit gamma